MSIAHVQSLSIQSGASKVSSLQSSAFVAPVTSGNAIIVAAWGTDQTVSSVTDTAGNTYTRINALTPQPAISMWLANNVTGGSGLKITINYAMADYPNFAAVEISGATATTDGTPTLTGNSATRKTPIITTTNANDILLTCYSSYASGTSTISAPSGWTLIGAQNNGTTYVSGGFAFQIVSSAQTNIQGTWTDAHASALWSSLAVALQAAITGGPFPWFLDQPHSGGFWDGGI